MAGQGQRKRGLLVKWLSDSRYRGKRVDWLEQGPPSRPKTADWLESGPPSRPKTADWLEEPPRQSRSSDTAARTPSPVGNAPGSTPTGSETSGPDHKEPVSWIDVTAGLLAIGLFVLMLVDHRPLEKALGAGLAVGVVVKVGLEVATFVYRYLRYFVVSGGAAAMAMGGAIAGNPHCLSPVTPDALDEQAICLYVSTFAPEMAPLVNVRSDLVPVESTGRRSLDLEDRRAWPDLGALFGSTAFASYGGTGAPAPEAVFSHLEQQRFNECMLSLYEAPAFTYKAWVIAKYQLSGAQAHDVVMDALLGVCENHLASQVKELRPYYWKAVKNRVFKLRQKKQKEVDCASVEEEPSTCLVSRYELTKGESRWLDQAVCRLTPDERETFERWKDGGSWAAIGKGLGLSAGHAANRFNNSLRKLSNHIDDMRCKNRGRFDDLAHEGRASLGSGRSLRLERSFMEDRALLDE